MSMVPEDVCHSCGAPLDAVGSCTGVCDPADREYDDDRYDRQEDEW